MSKYIHEIALAPRDIEDLTVYAGHSLTSVEGTLWITKGDWEDIVLKPGERVSFDRKVRVLVSGLHNVPARVRLTDDAAYAEAA